MTAEMAALARRVGLSVTTAGATAYQDRSTLRALVRDAIAQGLGGTATHAASRFVAPGATVLLKPNWVQDFNRSGATTDCLITHRNFIEAVLGEVLDAGAGKVVIADAPIQSARFEQLAPPAWRDHLKELGGRIPVEVVDLRNVITRKVGRRFVRIATERRTERLVMFDLAGSSLLEDISHPPGRFRCTNYDPDRIVEVQRPGVHKYVLSKEAFEADVIINLPKLKTHCKAGITAALKNLVGLNGDKDYLPHHRVGSPEQGGDCYAQAHVAKRGAELLFDVANRRIGRPGYGVAALIASAAARIALPIGVGGLDGGWHGNDTVWRMTLDLNRILLHGRADGTMSERPVRTIFTITDAILCGEGEGPLAPEPRALGAVTFASSSAYADLVHSALMHFDWQRIPLIREAFRDMRWALTSGVPQAVEIIVGGVARSLAEVGALYGRSFRPPDGWRGHVEGELAGVRPQPFASSTAS